MLSQEKNEIRIDKFLWCIRIFKTRKLSNESCTKSKVKINNKSIKPSYIVKVGDIIKIKKGIINFSIKVKSIITKRISAKLLDLYIEDITPESEKLKIHIAKNQPHAYRERGKGRPTKKERRDMKKKLENYFKS